MNKFNCNSSDTNKNANCDFDINSERFITKTNANNGFESKV